MAMRGLGKAVTIAAAGSAALATTAQAATFTVAPVKPCYVSGEKITAAGAGFTPGGFVNVAFDGKPLPGSPAPADAAGNFGGTIRVGAMKGVKTHALTATDQTNPALTAGFSFLGTTRQVVVKPRNARAGTKRRLKGYGFMSGPRVYMHVRGNGYSADKRVAKPSGPCGTFVTRRIIVPASAGLGRYRVQFDHKKKYSKKTRPRVVGSMTVSIR
jgi:hypothetical protein